MKRRYIPSRLPTHPSIPRFDQLVALIDLVKITYKGTRWKIYEDLFTKLNKFL